MAYGIECWNQLGQKTLSVDRRLLRVHQRVQWQIAGKANGTYTVPITGLSTDGTWAVVEGGNGWALTGTVGFKVSAGAIEIKIQTGTGSISYSEAGSAQNYMYFLILRC